jgi:DNA-binding transcriptional LysR family regulator
MLSFGHEVFIEVARNLSFSRAAEVLYISQPAITKHIQSLEKYYKVSLFERKGNAVTLTAEGKILLEHLSCNGNWNLILPGKKTCTWPRAL